MWKGSRPTDTRKASPDQNTEARCMQVPSWYLPCMHQTSLINYTWKTVLQPMSGHFLFIIKEHKETNMETEAETGFCTCWPWTVPLWKMFLTSIRVAPVFTAFSPIHILKKNSFALANCPFSENLLLIWNNWNLCLFCGAPFTFWGEVALLSADKKFAKLSKNWRSAMTIYFRFLQESAEWKPSGATTNSLTSSIRLSLSYLYSRAQTPRLVKV